jgi:hypothetical protein
VIWQLLLAHLLADFPLQFESLFELKKRSMIGVLLHSTICTLLAVLLAPHLITIVSCWLLFFISHALFDWLKVYITNKKASLDNLWFFLLDQALHILIILTACKLWPNSETPASPVIPYICIYTIVGPASMVFLFYFKRLFYDELSDINSIRSWYGCLERMAVLTLILLPSPFYFTIPLLFMVRGIIFTEEKDTSLDLVVSSFIAVFCGLIIIIFIR